MTFRYNVESLFMSLSRQDRLGNLEFALKLFVRDISDNYYREIYFSPEGNEYDQILLTTWQETQDGRHA